MQRHRGTAALAVAVILWASFALTVRGIGAFGLTPVDAAVLRFGTPVLLLAPWLPRALRAVRRERAGVVAALCLAGLPHFLLSALGGSLSTAALVGLLLPGSVPLFVALLLAGWRGERIRGRRLLALTAIVLGIAATAVLTTAAATIGGIGALLAAGLAWAFYTIALGRTRMDLTSVVLVVCTPSALAAVVLGLTGLLPAHLSDPGAVPMSHIALFVALQGIGTGILSTLSYAYAVRRLGSGIPAVTGAISPVLTTVLAVPLFGEPITAGVVVALTLVVGGVLAYNLTPAGQKAENEAGTQAGRKTENEAGDEAGLKTESPAGDQAGRKTESPAGNEAGRKAGNESGRKTQNQAGRKVGNRNGTGSALAGAPPAAGHRPHVRGLQPHRAAVVVKDPAPAGQFHGQ